MRQSESIKKRFEIITNRFVFGPKGPMNHEWTDRQGGQTDAPHCRIARVRMGNTCRTHKTIIIKNYHKIRDPLTFHILAWDWSKN